MKLSGRIEVQRRTMIILAICLHLYITYLEPFTG